MSYWTYSERFLSQAAAGTWTYEVPEGRRAVITSIDAANLGAEAAQCQVKLGIITLFYVPDLGTYKSITWRGRHVVYQGELVVLYIDAGVHSTISGYLLMDGSGATAAPGDVTRYADLGPMPDVEPHR